MNENENITDISAYRAARRRAGNIRWVLILVFLVACMFGGYFFSISSFFGIREVIIEGNEKVEEQRIIDLAEIHLGDNIFSVDTGRSASWIKMEPHIKDAEIHRRLPHSLFISVIERQAAACLMTGHALVYVDAYGRVLERQSTWSSLDVPVISGVDLSGCGSMPGVTIDGEGMTEALSIINTLPDDAVDIGEINVENPQFIKVYTISGVEIRLGDCSDFQKKYLTYSNIIRDNETENGQPIGYIDVSIVDKPTLTYR